MTLRHRQSLKRNSLLVKQTWLDEDTFTLDDVAKKSLSKLVITNQPALFIEWEGQIAVV